MRESRGSTEPRTPPLLRALLALLALFTLAVGLDPLRPEPRPASAPSALFSAGRALEIVDEIARVPHPTGTVEHDRVREWLASRLRELGLEVEIQERILVGDEGLPEQHPIPPPPGWVDAIRIRNIVARLPAPRGGGDREDRTALLLSAHYDSRDASPGASDDGSGVAIILEVVRILREEPDRDRELLVLLSDAEELGLEGARAFALEHPAAQEAAVTINLEARGSRGASRMFETTRGDAEWIEAYARSGAGSRADSLSASIYRHMGRDSDLTVLRQVGIAGYNFAFIRGYEHYHTPLDSVENLDPGTLQEQGESVLALARTLIRGELPAAGGKDAIYFPFGGRTWVGSTRLGHLLSLLALLLAIEALRRDLRSPAGAEGSLSRVLLGWSAGAVLVGLFVRMGTRAALEVASEGWSHPAPLAAAGEVTLALVAVGAALLLGLWRALHEDGSLRGGQGARAGVIFGIGLTVLLELILPRASYLGSLPLLGALLVLRSERASGAGAALLSLGALPALALWPTVLEGVAIAFGVGAAPLIALVGAAQVPLLAPLLGRITGGVPGRRTVVSLIIATLVLSTALTIVVRLAPGGPHAASVHHLQDLDAGSAEWGTFDARPGTFVGSLLDAGGVEEPTAERRELWEGLRGRHRHDDAPPPPRVSAAPVSAQADPIRILTAREGGEVRVTVEVPAGAMELQLIPEEGWNDVELLDGETWRPLRSPLTRLRLIAPPATVRLRRPDPATPGTQATAFRWIVTRPGLPTDLEETGPRRPPREMPSSGDRHSVMGGVRP
ncbi:MAG: M28 family peptidase [Planctomycetota bacterium]